MEKILEELQEDLDETVREHEFELTYDSDWLDITHSLINDLGYDLSKKDVLRLYATFSVLLKFDTEFLSEP